MAWWVVETDVGAAVNEVATEPGSQEEQPLSDKAEAAPLDAEKVVTDSVPADSVPATDVAEAVADSAAAKEATADGGAAADDQGGDAAAAEATDVIDMRPTPEADDLTDVRACLEALVAAEQALSAIHPAEGGESEAVVPEPESAVTDANGAASAEDAATEIAAVPSVDASSNKDGDAVAEGGNAAEARPDVTDGAPSEDAVTMNDTRTQLELEAALVEAQLAVVQIAAKRGIEGVSTEAVDALLQPKSADEVGKEGEGVVTAEASDNVDSSNVESGSVDSRATESAIAEGVPDADGKENAPISVPSNLSIPAELFEVAKAGLENLLPAEDADCAPADAQPKSVLELEAALVDARERQTAMNAALELAEAGGEVPEGMSVEEAKNAVTEADTSVAILTEQLDQARANEAEQHSEKDRLENEAAEHAAAERAAALEAEELAKAEAEREAAEEAARLKAAAEAKEVLRRKVQLAQLLQVEKQRKETLVQDNTMMQSIIAELLRKRKEKEGRDSQNSQPQSIKNVSEQEARYAGLLKTINETTQKIEQEQHDTAEIIAELEEEKEAQSQNVIEAKSKLMKLLQKLAGTVVSSRTGKPMPEAKFAEFKAAAEEKEKILRGERLRYIKLRNEHKRLEAELQEKEQLEDGLHFIDFETLKIENQSFNEKVEERNEELAKLKRKISSTVQVLSHIKEKLAFTESKNVDEKERLKQIEADLAKERDIVSRQKRIRDKLRRENADLQQQCGLIGRTVLLRDYETQREESERCTADIALLRERLATARSRVHGYKQKLEQLQKQQPELFVEE